MLDITSFSSRYSVRLMTENDADIILNFCLQNVHYYQYCGKYPSKDLILNDLHMTPPGVDKMSKYYVGFYDSDTLVAIMDLIDGYPSVHDVFIGFFMVQKQLQGNQIGTKIIQEICSYLKEIGMIKIRLGIDKENPRSNQFWKKNGFHVIKEVQLDNGIVLLAEKMLSMEALQDKRLKIINYLGKEVFVKIDRPLGSVHPNHEDLIYQVNYGYLPNTYALDGEEQDAYVIGVDEPISEFTGIVVAIIIRINDNEDKLVVCSTKNQFSKQQIKELTDFQERHFNIEIVM